MSIFFGKAGLGGAASIERISPEDTRAKVQNGEKEKV
jgi:hypothetical protein